MEFGSVTLKINGGNHVVLSREDGLISLGLASQETVTQVSPESRC